MTAAIIIIVCCWIFSFFFNGIESGLLSIDPVRLRQNVKRRVPAALQLNRLLKRPERLLATVLLVTNAADIVALLLLTSQLFQWYGYAGVLVRLGHCASGLFICFVGSAKIVVPAISISRAGAACRCSRITSILFSPLLELGARLGKLLLPGHARKRGAFLPRARN